MKPPPSKLGSFYTPRFQEPPSLVTKPADRIAQHMKEKCSFSGEVDGLFEVLSEYVESHGYGDAPRGLGFANMKAQPSHLLPVVNSDGAVSSNES